MYISAAAPTVGDGEGRSECEQVAHQCVECSTMTLGSFEPCELSSDDFVIPVGDIKAHTIHCVVVRVVCITYFKKQIGLFRGVGIID